MLTGIQVIRSVIAIKNSVKIALDDAYKTNCKYMSRFETITDIINTKLNHLDNEILKIKNDLEAHNFDENLNVYEIIKEVTDTIGKLKYDFEIEVESIQEKKKDNLEYFTISFFGITNAGKSTVIEAFTQEGNGLTIGEGKQNTTKAVTASTLGRLRVLDTPGFEGGKEFELLAKEEIQKTDLAIFICSNKAPERAEVEKISEWVKENNLPFILLINSRIPNSSYASVLEIPQVKKIVDYSDQLLREDLKIKRYTILPINAQLAFLSRCNIDNERTDLIKIKSIMLDQFDTMDIINQYSNFQGLEELIEDIIINDSSILKIKNIYESMSIFLDKIINLSIKNIKSLNYVNTFTYEKTGIIIKEFGKKDDYGKKGKELKEIIDTKLFCVDEFERENIGIIHHAIDTGEKKVHTKLSDHINTFSNNMSTSVLPAIAEEITKTLETKLINLEKDMDLEIIGFINISILSDVVKDAVEDFNKNKFRSKLKLGLEIILKAAETMAYIKSFILVIILSFINSLSDQVFGKSSRHLERSLIARNKKKQEASEILQSKCKNLKEVIKNKLWQGYYDKRNNQSFPGFKNLLHDLRKQIRMPLDSLFYSSKNGSELLKDLIEDLKQLKLDIDLELYREVFKEVSGQEIGITKVVRRAGVSSIVFCENEQDLELLNQNKVKISKLLQDQYQSFFIWKDDHYSNIDQLLKELTSGKAKVHSVVVNKDRNVINIDVIRSVESEMYKEKRVKRVKMILGYLYSERINIRRLS